MQHHYGHNASAKVLVLGDSGVGKSSLVHMLCHNEPLQPAIPTVGCNIDVRLHTSVIPTTAATSVARNAGIPSLLSRTANQSNDSSSISSGNESFIEFYDISGSPAVRHPKTRNMFYSGATYQGLILVHDLCNRRSYDNLWKWIGDYMEASSQAAGSLTTGGYLGVQSDQLNIPLLVVGTKNDMATSYEPQQLKGYSGFSADHGMDLVQKHNGEAISVCSISPAEFMPNSSASIAFNMFFTRVMDPSSASSSSRSRHPSSQGAVVYPSGASPLFSPRAPPTLTPGQERPQHQDRAFSHDSNSGSHAIPIMDFATFTGGGSSSATSVGGGDSARTPDWSAEGHRAPTTRVGVYSSQVQVQASDHGYDHARVPSRSVTPTGTKLMTNATSPTKSSLRAQYERNRSVLSQYSNMGVPVYTGGSRSHTPTGS
ncbi:Rab-like protein 3 [Mortierella claussenii]|nr:Rab-like protein 3 [Mortierella claussenii]